jgi:glycosyltransferase involved in cell wall biosynthesis
MNASFGLLDLSEESPHFPDSVGRKLLKLKSNVSDVSSSSKYPVVCNVGLNKMKEYDSLYSFIPYFSVKTNEIPTCYLNMLKNKNKIFAYNKFTKSALCDSGINDGNVFVVPPSINSSIFRNAEAFGVNDKRMFSFLSVVNVYSDSNWLSVVRSFYEEFSAKDDVCLVLKAQDCEYTKYHATNIARKIKAEKNRFHKDLPPVVLISASLTDTEMASLYIDCDFFVKVSGINSGLSFVEAFASGLVCIGPSEGASRDILNRDTGFMVKKSGERRMSSGDSSDGTTYSTYDEGHLSEIMRWVVENYSNLKEKTIKERKIILSQFDHHMVGQKFIKSLR